MGEAGLAQSGRPVEKDMVDRLAAALGGGDGDFQVLLEGFLADEVVQLARAQVVIEGGVLIAGLAGNYTGDFITSSVRINLPRGEGLVLLLYHKGRIFSSPGLFLRYSLFVYLIFYFFSRLGNEADSCGHSFLRYMLTRLQFLYLRFIGSAERGIVHSYEYT